MVDSRSKVGLVTGASKGIGAAIARRLAADGFAIAINFAASCAQATTLVEEIVAAGGQALAVKADIADPAAVAHLFVATLGRFGRLDVLVHNAGIQLLGAISETEDEAFDHLVAVNLKGAFNVLRAGAGHIADGGRIIALSSGTTDVLPPRYSIYAATKAAVEALTGVLAKEMRGRDVTVNALAPGPVATALYFAGKTPAMLDVAANRSPLGRIGLPDDIAAVISALAGPGGGWVNGQTILANGGFH